MDEQEIQKGLTVCIIILLGVAWLFTVKAFVDNRVGVQYARRREKMFQDLQKETSLKEKDKMLAERDRILKEAGERYRFPKLFFFFFVIVSSGISVWAFTLVTKLPHESRVYKRNTNCLVLLLFVFGGVLFCFFLMDLHYVVRLGWVFLLLILQWGLLGGAGALYFSKVFYETVMGLKEDKSLIQGPPPPAWE